MIIFHVVVSFPRSCCRSHSLVSRFVHFSEFVCLFLIKPIARHPSLIQYFSIILILPVNVILPALLRLFLCVC